MAPLLEGPPEIGRYYSVPCAYGDLYGSVSWWPVLGPLHEDAAIINFPKRHLHLDFRFFSGRQWGWFAKRRPGCEYAAVLQEFLCDPPVIELQRRKCKRALRPYPFHSPPWLLDLENAFEGCRLKPGLVCPHRGAPLASLPAEDGVVTCPLHGLRWNVETGALVRSTVRPRARSAEGRR